MIPKTVFTDGGTLEWRIAPNDDGSPYSSFEYRRVSKLPGIPSSEWAGAFGSNTFALSRERVVECARLLGIEAEAPRPTIRDRASRLHNNMDGQHWAELINIAVGPPSQMLPLSLGFIEAVLIADEKNGGGA